MAVVILLYRQNPSYFPHRKGQPPFPLSHTHSWHREMVCVRESQLNSSRVSSNSSCARNPENQTDNKLRQQQLVSVYSSMQMLF